MIVVSDTTPIISLIKAECLDILKTLFGSVCIPSAVFDELIANEKYSHEADYIRRADFIFTKELKDKKSVRYLQIAAKLDLGESEAIALAEEMSADLLLMDELRGRHIAEELGIKITGTIGILLQAYDEKILTVDDVMICMDKFKESNIRISERLHDLVTKYISEA